ncbi:glycerol-3-phosphate 1-O-acyltransferase PlsY [Verrucomicrobiales bacterium BCK34]|nr:glycerol-3-phosphate 1-O-acyltransferase PlsY [Verrucomicrobiales bacterium BCK34]
MNLISDLYQYWWLLLGAYVIGATPFGFIAGKMKGIDIRQHGSGNIGATNVLRTLGKPIGITVLVMDILKGLLPVVFAQSLSDNSLVHVVTAIATILGHNYTFWLGFKGGKGIATTGGAVLPIMPFALVAAVIVWIITVKTTRYVSVASIAAAITIPLIITIRGLIQNNLDAVVLGLGLFVCILAIWKHRSNIGRLRRGEELQFGRKKTS